MEKNNKKEPSGTLSIVCGIITILTGILICFTGNYQNVAFVFLFITMLLNLYLHCESYISSKRVGFTNGGVLSIIIVEIVFMILLIVYLVQMLKGNFEFWETLMIVFSCYLVFNGALLIAIPMEFAMFSGASAIVTAFLVFITANSWGVLPAIFLGISLIINGSERVVMAQLARIAKKKLLKNSIGG